MSSTWAKSAALGVLAAAGTLVAAGAASGQSAIGRVEPEVRVERRLQERQVAPKVLMEYGQQAEPERKRRVEVETRARAGAAREKQTAERLGQAKREIE